MNPPLQIDVPCWNRTRPAGYRLVCLVVALLLGPAGCSRPAAEIDGPGSTGQTEASWERQVDAIRGDVSNRIEITEASISDEQFRQLLTDCAGLQVLLIGSLDASTKTLSEVLPKLTSLRQLMIGTRVPAEVFPQIAQLQTLEILNLPQARCTDRELPALAALPRLKLLRLHSPLITDVGLKSLPEFPALRYLHLIGIPLTDAALPSIAECKRLQSFYLDGGNCTESGLARLLEQHPDLHFHWNDLHLDEDPNRHPHE